DSRANESDSPAGQAGRGLDCVLRASSWKSGSPAGRAGRGPIPVLRNRTRIEDGWFISLAIEQPTPTLPHEAGGKAGWSHAEANRPCEAWIESQDTLENGCTPFEIYGRA